MSDGRGGGQQQQQAQPHALLDLESLEEKAPKGYVRREHLASLERCGASPRSKDLATNAFDELQVESILGEGGYGRIQKVRHRRLDESFALKVLYCVNASQAYREEGGNEMVLASSHLHTYVTSYLSTKTSRFKTVTFNAQRLEMMALQRLQGCENIVAMIAVDDRKPTAPILLELCEGTLADAIYEEESLLGRSTADICRYMSEVADGLDYCHGKGIVHCDLKSSNALLARKPPGSSAPGSHVVKVADFGLSTSVGVWRLPGSGTIGTVAPEVNMDGGKNACPLQDVFSVGSMAGTVFANNEYLTNNMFESTMLETEKERGERIALRKAQQQDDDRIYALKERLSQRTAVDGSARRIYLIPQNMREDMPEKSRACAAIGTMIDPNPANRPTMSVVSRYFRRLITFASSASGSATPAVWHTTVASGTPASQSPTVRNLAQPSGQILTDMDEAMGLIVATPENGIATTVSGTTAQSPPAVAAAAAEDPMYEDLQERLLELVDDEPEVDGEWGGMVVAVAGMNAATSTAGPATIATGGTRALPPPVSRLASSGCLSVVELEREVSAPANDTFARNGATGALAVNNGFPFVTPAVSAPVAVSTTAPPDSLDFPNLEEKMLAVMDDPVDENGEEGRSNTGTVGVSCGGRRPKGCLLSGYGSVELGGEQWGSLWAGSVTQSMPPITMETRRRRAEAVEMLATWSIHPGLGRDNGGNLPVGGIFPQYTVPGAMETFVEALLMDDGTGTGALSGIRCIKSATLSMGPFLNAGNAQTDAGENEEVNILASTERTATETALKAILDITKGDAAERVDVQSPAAKGTVAGPSAVGDECQMTLQRKHQEETMLRADLRGQTMVEQASADEEIVSSKTAEHGLPVSPSTGAVAQTIGNWQERTMPVPGRFREVPQQPTIPTHRSRVRATQRTRQDGCDTVVGRMDEYSYGYGGPDGWYLCAATDQVQGGAGRKRGNGGGKEMCHISRAFSRRTSHAVA